MPWNEDEFRAARSEKLVQLAQSLNVRNSARECVRSSYTLDYCYQWDWAGFPILQMPEDIVALQEILFRCRPSVVIETGVAWGGGCVLVASIMSLYRQGGSVLGIDLNLRDGLEGKVRALELPVDIHFLKGSSTSLEAQEWALSHVSHEDSVMVILDSHHTHEHVLEELRIYSLFVTEGQYLIVGDTSVSELSTSTERIRPWDSERNPMSAVEAFLEESSDFHRDHSLEAKMLTTFHPGGYLRRI